MGVKEGWQWEECLLLSEREREERVERKEISKQFNVDKFCGSKTSCISSPCHASANPSRKHYSNAASTSSLARRVEQSRRLGAPVFPSKACARLEKHLARACSRYCCTCRIYDASSCRQHHTTSPSRRRRVVCASERANERAIAAARPPKASRTGRVCIGRVGTREMTRGNSPLYLAE